MGGAGWDEDEDDFKIMAETGTRPSSDHRVHVSAETAQGGWQSYQEARETSPRGHSKEENLAASFFGSRGGKS